jgi:hypothetical protein
MGSRNFQYIGAEGDGHRPVGQRGRPDAGECRSYLLAQDLLTRCCWFDAVGARRHQDDSINAER